MTNQNLKMTVIDAVTGEVIERPFTDEEIADYEIINSEQSELESNKDARLAARQSALAKLKALGLTESEIAAL